MVKLSDIFYDLHDFLKTLDHLIINHNGILMTKLYIPITRDERIEENQMRDLNDEEN